MELNLPMDAEGNVIPFDTEHLYLDNGSKQDVVSFTFNKKESLWLIETKFSICDSTNFHLNKPDSLKQLAADIDRTLNHPDGIVCAYANRKRRECNGCKLSGHLSCLKAFTSDISSRVHRLAGDAE